ncbi:unnamed protein product [Psylliodes chrysocephalus]|uniref:Vacuolar protein sorting-associated protein VTA1-like protein n=1 Tax=Psylliodes chrysocephalus TaxID=3402493 RepID=A0A9P0CR36_9CUCU|nr:unnamed protein product [Psylliodes chrysocephala]
MVKFPPVTAEVKPLAHLLKLADEHDERNIVVAYWARMSACLLALQLVPGKKSPQTAELMRALLDWLEQTKKANHENEGITSETTAQALIEEYALRLFSYADQQDRAQIFNKNTVKTFYTAGILMDVLDQFGTLPDDIREKRKYAKWKAAYIHNCLKAGETPMSGPPRSYNEDGDDDGIVHNSQLSQEELSTYTKYTGPVSFDDAKKPMAPPSPPPEIPFIPPKPMGPNNEDNSNYAGGFSHVPASSPITPLAPVNPTPFFPPAPAEPSPAPITPSEPFKPAVAPKSAVTGYAPSPAVIQKAQKYTKFATSALNYDDVKSAMDNLQKAMNLLQCGAEE